MTLGEMVSVHILILAAGASSRMRGSDKLLQPVAGFPLLRQVAKVALATNAFVWVALPAGSDARREAVTGLPVHIVEVPDAALGMSRSLCQGIGAIGARAGPLDGVMILPADMPDFTTEALDEVILRFKAEPDLIFRGGTEDGRPGHPTLFPRVFWPELALVTGDEGGRSVLKRHQGRVRIVPLPGQMALVDLDSPEDWAAWRAGSP